MNKKNIVLEIATALILLILLNNPIIMFLGNINSLFKRDNRTTMESEALKDKINYLEEELSSYEKSLNNLKLYTDPNYILSKTAIRNIYDFYDYIIINTDKKVNKGATVVNEFGLVGVVESSNKTTAKVKLLTGNTSISVKINDVYGQLEGYDRKNKLLVVHNIDNYKDVKIKTQVLTSGLTEIKRDIKIGEVEKIEKKGLEQVVYVKPYVDFDNINYLYCIN